MASVPWNLQDYILLGMLLALFYCRPFKKGFKHQYDTLVSIIKQTGGSEYIYCSPITFGIIWTFVWACMIAGTFMYMQHGVPQDDYFMAIVILIYANVTFQKHWECIVFEQYRMLACKILVLLMLATAWAVFALLVVEYDSVNSPYFIAAFVLWAVAALWLTYIAFLTIKFSRLLNIFKCFDFERKQFEITEQKAMETMKKNGNPDYFAYMHDPYFLTHPENERMMGMTGVAHMTENPRSYQPQHPHQFPTFQMSGNGNGYGSRYGANPIPKFNKVDNVTVPFKKD